MRDGSCHCLSAAWWGLAFGVLFSIAGPVMAAGISQAREVAPPPGDRGELLYEMPTAPVAPSRPVGAMPKARSVTPTAAVASSAAKVAARTESRPPVSPSSGSSARASRRSDVSRETPVSRAQRAKPGQDASNRLTKAPKRRPEAKVVGRAVGAGKVRTSNKAASPKAAVAKPSAVPRKAPGPKRAAAATTRQVPPKAIGKNKVAPKPSRRVSAASIQKALPKTAARAAKSRQAKTQKSSRSTSR